MKAKPFATEADLCAAFIAWAARSHPEIRCYAEWAGWDILLVYPEGWQLGIQAKLRLNAEVIGQAAPSSYGYEYDHPGPDFRGVLVPEVNPLSGIAARLGLIVFAGVLRGYPKSMWQFSPALDCASMGAKFNYAGSWLDWNPRQRHTLPPTLTDAVAGSPCPVSLTPWKLGALAVLAELAAKGSITTKRIKEIGVNPSRWLQASWLVPGDQRGVWLRGDACPKFDEQHPTAYAHALEKAKEAMTA